MMHGTGDFDVKILPLDYHTTAEPTLGRMSIDKVLHGDLEGTSKGEMLTGGTAVNGSAVYVAVERITGTLHGRTGAFTVHHLGVMNRGVPSLTITIVPDSGTDGLTGITGAMKINIVGGKHSYEIDYSLPPA